MEKPTKVHDLQYYKTAQINVERLEKTLKDLDKVEDLLYNHIKYGSIWQLVQDLTDIKIQMMYDYQGWKDTVENGGEVR